MTRDETVEAINAGRVIRFHYTSVGAVYTMVRVVSPWQADEYSFIGYDHDRDETRRFRYDRAAESEFADEEQFEYVQPND